MRSLRTVFCISLVVVCAALLPVGCGPSTIQTGETGDDGAPAESGVGYSFPVTAGKYEVLDILTDNKDEKRAQDNAADAITRYPDIKCMVGLWAYNPPQILNALEEANKVGEVQVVGFDEHDATLQAIREDKIHGTIVQQPFVFGYTSVEYLAALARGIEVEPPANDRLYIDHMVITKENVDDWGVKVANMRDGRGEPPAHRVADHDTSERVKVAFMTNSRDPFWDLAEQGCKMAAEKFNVECTYLAPPAGTVEQQQQYVEDLITDQCQGLAISPINPKDQVDIINQACEKMHVLCQDSDAPDTNRKFYLGTSNYMAGRAAGKLVKEALPGGGKVMIFVGKLEVLNAQERSRGLIDELMDKPLPKEFAGE